MPHTARAMSASGYYHVVPKGIAGQLLFGDDADRRSYLKLLGQAKEKTGIRIHAYCIMSNHVHLVVENADGALGSAMKYLDERYGTYYAEKIGRSDGVFRKPFWSEPIEDDARLLCAVRYVHANPAAAGICHASVYPWSSVGDYLSGPGHTSNVCAVPGIAETSVVLDLLGGRAGFIEWSKPKESTALPFLGSTLKRHLTMDEALCIATAVLGHDPRSGSTINEAQLLLSRGFSVSQIERLTGITRYQILKKR